MCPDCLFSLKNLSIIIAQIIFTVQFRGIVYKFFIVSSFEHRLGKERLPQIAAAPLNLLYFFIPP